LQVLMYKLRFLLTDWTVFICLWY